MSSRNIARTPNQDTSALIRQMYPASLRIFPDHILAITQVRRHAPFCAKRRREGRDFCRKEPRYAEDQIIMFDGLCAGLNQRPRKPAKRRQAAPSTTKTHTLLWRRLLCSRIGDGRKPAGQPATFKAWEPSLPVSLRVSVRAAQNSS